MPHAQRKPSRTEDRAKPLCDGMIGVLPTLAWLSPSIMQQDGTAPDFAESYPPITNRVGLVEEEPLFISLHRWPTIPRLVHVLGSE